MDKIIVAASRNRHKIEEIEAITDKGEFIEIQGTGEDRPFTPAELNELLALAAEGCRQLHQIQKETING